MEPVPRILFYLMAIAAVAFGITTGILHRDLDKLTEKLTEQKTDFQAVAQAYVAAVDKSGKTGTWLCVCDDGSLALHDAPHQPDPNCRNYPISTSLHSDH